MFTTPTAPAARVPAPLTERPMPHTARRIAGAEVGELFVTLVKMGLVTRESGTVGAHFAVTRGAVAEALDAHRTETFPFTRDGEVAATVTDGVSDHIDRDDTCAALTSGDADLVLLDENELSACFGGETDQAARLRDAGVKMYAPVVAGATTFFVTVRSDAIAIDDEPAELTLDGVSSQISAGQDVAGDPADRARELMAAAGVLK